MTWARVRAQFEALLDLPAAEQHARLAELAATEPGLAADVRRLLASDAAALGYLERPAAPPLVAAAAGQCFGRYELVRLLGSGGMGSVWEAVQHDPERRVALKLSVRGAQSAAERWRFEHEVRVLAALSHPAIATFFDAGTVQGDGTEVAWLAMELVDGARDVLRWADDQALARDQRIALFLRLCDAVAHGHRHGVLHRDLKAGNVLVSHDGQLKLIDFGVARALGTDGDAAPRTTTGELVGSLFTMAPEQLRGRPAAVGVGADVYALGVLLYQLLCGRLPFDFAGRSLAEVARIVLEQEPLPARAVRPDLPADLGWILAQALQKDPQRRYPTVEALVADLQRYRAHLPVTARAPRLGYRLAKFMRRHRIGALVAAALGGGLALGGYGLWHGAEEARAEAVVARRANEVSREVLRVVTDLFENIDDTEASRELTVHQLLASAGLDERATADPLVEQAVREVRGRTFARLRRFPEARAELERAHELHGRAAAPGDAAEAARVAAHGQLLAADLGRVLTRTGERPRGEQLLRAAVAATARGAEDRTRRKVLTTFCQWLADENLAAELLPAAEELRAVGERMQNAATVLLAEQRIAEAASRLGRHDLAIEASGRAWRAACERFGDEHRVPCAMLQTHVRALQVARRLDEAEALYPRLVAACRTVFGEGHGNHLAVLNNQVALLFARGRMAEAVAGMQQIVDAHEARGGPLTAERVTAIHNLGQVLTQANRFAEAEPHLRRAAAAAPAVFGPEDPDGLWMPFHLGACLAWQQKWTEAEPLLRSSHERLAAVLPPGDPDLAKARTTLAAAHAHNGDASGAAAWRARAQ